MKTSFCITAYDQDCYLVLYLLEILKQQTVAPDEIIIYVSGISKIDLPKQIPINQNIIPIYTVLSHKRTIQSVARNICAKIASNDIIIFFDVDDEPHPQKIEITNNVFSMYNTDFVLHNYISSNIRQQPSFSPIDPNLITSRTDLMVDTQSTNLICGNMPIHHAHIAVKKTVFNTICFNEDLKYYRKEDGKFCQDLIQNNFIGTYCTEPLVRYINS